MNYPLFIAELSANHNGSLAKAMSLVSAAHMTGADAIKLQTFKPEKMVADPAYVLPDGPWKGRNLLELYQETYTPWEWHKPLFDYARDLGMKVISTAFCEESVDFLVELDVDYIKIASFEAIDLPLIKKAASTGKSLIVSMGMAKHYEITQVLKHICCHLTLLKCTSAYPSDLTEANIKTMWDMNIYKYLYHGRNVDYHNTDVDIGLSDHTLGHTVAVAATALGATMIEKHFTLSRAEGGPDAAFSMEPGEFKMMVAECKRTADAIGTVQYGPQPSEMAQYSLRRSLYFAQDIPENTIITESHLKTARPSLGLSPLKYYDILGKTTTRAVRVNEPVQEGDLQ